MFEQYIESNYPALKATLRFLEAGEENREWLAYLATKGTIKWTYSHSLESVKRLLNIKSQFEKGLYGVK